MMSTPLVPNVASYWPDNELRLPLFTAREGPILTLAATGLTDKEIARRLGVTHRTVRTHFERLFERHELRGRAAAIAVWLRNSSAWRAAVLDRGQPRDQVA